jgi:cold shock CspA family protein
MPRGTISLLTVRGFGFIRTERGEELFFYRTALQGSDYRINFSSLRVGQEVEFVVGKGWRGKARAINVRILQPRSK